MNTELQHNKKELLKVNDSNLSLQKSLKQAQSTVSKYESELEQGRAKLSKHEVEFNSLRNKANRLSFELELSRNRRVNRWMDRIFNRFDLRDDISPAFQQLQDDSSLFTKKINGYRLQPGINLQQVPFLSYPLDLDRPNLKGILLAPILNLPLSTGVLGVEIISPSNIIVTQSSLPVTRINESEPIHFMFSPINDTDKGRFWLRVFARDTDGPIRIFEWRKRSAFGLGPLQTRAFCGFLFENGR